MATTYDRVLETTTTTGTGTYTLAGAKDGYQAFSAVVGDAEQVYYAAHLDDDWEVGIGTFTLAGTLLARTTILASSNAGLAVNWPAGEKNIWVNSPAQLLRNFQTTPTDNFFPLWDGADGLLKNSGLSFDAANRRINMFTDTIWEIFVKKDAGGFGQFLNITTENGAGGFPSGGFAVTTGSAVDNNSGNIVFTTGNVTGTSSAGGISFFAGHAQLVTGGSGGHITLDAGNTVNPNLSGGSIFIRAGDNDAYPGPVAAGGGTVQVGSGSGLNSGWAVFYTNDSYDNGIVGSVEIATGWTDTAGGGTLGDILFEIAWEQRARITNTFLGITDGSNEAQILTPTGLTANRTYAFPDASGTFALAETVATDLLGYLKLAGRASGQTAFGGVAALEELNLYGRDPDVVNAGAGSRLRLTDDESVGTILTVKQDSATPTGNASYQFKSRSFDWGWGNPADSYDWGYMQAANPGRFIVGTSGTTPNDTFAYFYMQGDAGMNIDMGHGDDTLGTFTYMKLDPDKLGIGFLNSNEHHQLRAGSYTVFDGTQANSFVLTQTLTGATMTGGDNENDVFTIQATTHANGGDIAFKSSPSRTDMTITQEGYWLKNIATPWLPDSWVDTDFTPFLQWHTTSEHEAGWLLGHWAQNNFGSSINFVKQYAASIGTRGTPQQHTVIGSINWWQGTNFAYDAAAGSIRMISDDSTGTSSAHTSMRFYVAWGSTIASERLRITPNTGIWFGRAIPSLAAFITFWPLQRDEMVFATNDNEASYGTFRFVSITNTSGREPTILFDRARGTIHTFPTVVNNGDLLGEIRWQGQSTTGSTPAFENAASIRAEVDGTPGATDMPGRIKFFTTLDGTATLVERMKIDNAGTVTIGGIVSANRFMTVDNFGRLTIKYNDNSLQRVISLKNLGLSGANQGTRIAAYLSSDGSEIESGAIDFLSANATHTGATADTNIALSSSLNGSLTTALAFNGDTRTWESYGHFIVRSGNSLYVRDNANTDWGQFYHDGTHFVGTFVNTLYWQMTGLAAMKLLGGGTYYAQDVTNSYFTIVSASSVLVGEGIDANSAAIEIGRSRSVDGASYIDFHGATGTDYDSRIIRGAGLNGNWQFDHNGTGDMIFSTDVSVSSLRIRGQYGNVGINGTPSTAAQLHVLGTSMSGVTEAVGTYNTQVISSANTVAYNAFYSAVSTEAAAFTINNLYHYRAINAGVGAGSTITNQWGYNCSDLTSGSNINAAFRSAMSFGTNKYGAYFDGDANNYFAGRINQGTTAFTAGQTGWIRMNKTITGATDSRGFYQDATTASDVTSSSIHFYSGTGTAAASFSLSALYNYLATVHTIGAGSTVAVVAGYVAGSALGSKGTSFSAGFRGLVAAGTGNYNLYMDGTAMNRFAGNLGIGRDPEAAYGLDSLLGVRLRGNLVVADTTAGTDFGIQSHDGTDYNWVFTNTTDLNIIGITGIDLNGATDVENALSFTAGNVVSNQVTFYARGTAASGAVNSFGFRTSETIPSSTTGVYNGFYSGPSTAAAAFAVTAVYHFRVVDVGIGAGSSVGAQHGIQIPDLVGATTNRGFRSAVTIGTNQWNIYADGTAQNFIQGFVGIGGSNSRPDVALDLVGTLRIADAGDTDWLEIAHDGTNIEFTGTNTGQMNIHGMHLDVHGGSQFRVYGPTNVGTMTVSHDDTNFYINHASTAQYRISNLTDGVWIRDGAWLRISDSADTDYIQIGPHDGTDINISFVNTTDLNITGLTAFNFGTAVLNMTEGSAPATPAANDWRLYFKTDGLYYKDDAGAETGPLRGITLGTMVAAATGSPTQITFTGIPATAKRVKINFSGVSTNGTSVVMVRLGDSGGPENTGYLGSTGRVAGGTATAFTAGIAVVEAMAAAAVIHGTVTIELMDASTNLWAATVVMGLSNGGQVEVGGYSKATSATLDRVQITTAGGTDTFDAGNINISYEE